MCAGCFARIMREKDLSFSPSEKETIRTIHRLTNFDTLGSEGEPLRTVLELEHSDFDGFDTKEDFVDFLEKVASSFNVIRVFTDDSPLTSKVQVRVSPAFTAFLVKALDW